MGEFAGVLMSLRIEVKISFYIKLPFTLDYRPYPRQYNSGSPYSLHRAFGQLARRNITLAEKPHLVFRKCPNNGV